MTSNLYQLAEQKLESCTGHRAEDITPFAGQRVYGRVTHHHVSFGSTLSPVSQLYIVDNVIPVVYDVISKTLKNS